MQNEFEMLEFIMMYFRDFLGIWVLNRVIKELQFVFFNKVMNRLLYVSRKKCIERKVSVKWFEKVLDRLVCYVNVINDIENEDDLFCCYIFWRICYNFLKKVKIVDFCL